MSNVLKATGKLEPFSEEKLRTSIKRAGIPENLQNDAVALIKSKLRDNIPTSEIYKEIIDFLQTSAYPLGRGKYSLKQSIMDLGPTGYPFEDYIAEILKMEGYQAQVRQILNGKCVSHEIDVIIEKDKVKSMIECKFHNSPGTRSQIHVSLYTKARFDDIREKNNLNEAWLVTNTKITQDALAYALCSNMKVISWDYPANRSFRDLIEKYQLHPVTMLTTISQSQKQMLLENHTVLVKEICKNPSCLDILGLPKDKREEIILECRSLYK